MPKLTIAFKSVWSTGPKWGKFKERVEDKKGRKPEEVAEGHGVL